MEHWKHEKYAAGKLGQSVLSAMIVSAEHISASKHIMSIPLFAVKIIRIDLHSSN